MRQTKSLPSYTQVTNALKKTQSDFQAAEVHGLLCGIISATSKATDVVWETLITGPQQNQKSHALLQRLYTASYEKINEFSFEFVLLLPDDTTDINVRTEALGLWCQGFLTGLQQRSASPHHHMTSEAKEAIDDITEIAQVSYGDIPNTEENETAYLELVEYIRLAVLMIFSEIKSHLPQSSRDNSNPLH